MPMLDVHIPAGALRPEAERALCARLTDIVMTWEGFDPGDPVMRAVSWVFVHRPDVVYVAGAPAQAPRYRVVAAVPEGQIDDRGRRGLVAEVTEAILDAEEGARPRDEGRIWVFPTDVPEGQWGGRGGIVRLADILERVTSSREEAQRLAAERITRSRAERASKPDQEAVG